MDLLNEDQVFLFQILNIFVSFYYYFNILKTCPSEIDEENLDFQGFYR